MRFIHEIPSQNISPATHDVTWWMVLNHLCLTALWEKGPHRLVRVAAWWNWRGRTRHRQWIRRFQ